MLPGDWVSGHMPAGCRDVLGLAGDGAGSWKTAACSSDPGAGPVYWGLPWAEGAKECLQNTCEAERGQLLALFGARPYSKCATSVNPFFRFQKSKGVSCWSSPFSDGEVGTRFQSW